MQGEIPYNTSLSLVCIPSEAAGVTTKVQTVDGHTGNRGEKTEGWNCHWQWCARLGSETRERPFENLEKALRASFKRITGASSEIPKTYKSWMY